jgi:O-succinylbenzoate synthase
MEEVLATSLRIEAVELDFVEIPLKAPVQTSFGVETTKSAWIVTVCSQGIKGYAECVADVEPLYSGETHASAYFAWKNDLVPRLSGVAIESPHDVGRLMAPVRGNQMAKAALEMAIWDWFAKSQQQPLWTLLGGQADRQAIPVGVSIGIQPSDRALISRAEAYLAEGYRRLKVKIQPGTDIERLRALRKAVGPDVLIMADANSAYTLADTQHLAGFDALDLMMLEQPLAYDDIIDHRTLAQSIRTPICLDEAIHSADDARKALAIGACQIINIKVGRVGGHSEARRLHDIALSQGAPVWCGGMLETGIGRAHNLHLSTLSNFRLPGDTSASDRYFDEDLIDPPFHLNPDGTLSVPDGPGIGVQPDPHRLAKYRAHHERWRIEDVRRRGGRPYGSPTSF